MLPYIKKETFYSLVFSCSATLLISACDGNSSRDVSVPPTTVDATAQLTAEAEAKRLEDQRRLQEIVQIPEVTQVGYPAEDIPLMAQALPATSGLDRWGRPRQEFVNWETPHVHPMDLTPDGSLLLAVNTAANTLMIFSEGIGNPQLIKTVPVGLDPVSVRALSANQAWVTNLASDTVSVVDLNLGSVVKTLYTEDEPADVVFAGSRAFVACSQANRVNVFELGNLDAEPESLFINGEDPRAMAVSADGSEVYVAIFESGNQTTLINGGTNNTFQVDYVRRGDSPYNGRAIPPNRGDEIVPAINPSLPGPPPVAMIVRKQPDGRWLDDNNGDWTYVASPDTTSGARGSRVAGWDLPDRDIAVINVADLTVSYRNTLMNILMAIDVNPENGDVLTVGTDATNEIRFEPNLNGTFVRVIGASVTTDGTKTITDLNPHLDYETSTIPVAQRELSIGDPRGVEFADDGSFALVTGMGSNNLIVLNADTSRQAQSPIEVGEGPTGVVLNNSESHAYVLNKFAGSISVVDTSSWQQTAEVAFYDPTPAVVKDGRAPFYDTHVTSGLGQASCASCHVDGRTDRLAWDLGDPTKEMIVARGGLRFHPMKGPLLTQTLQDAISSARMHWRGDVNDLAHGFTGTPEGLQGDDRPYNEDEMQRLEAFLDTIHYPSNPNRDINNNYRTNLAIPGPNNTIARRGNAAAGAGEFERECRRCHLGNTARSNDPFFADAFGIAQMRIGPTWRGFHERFGIWNASADGSNTGFGTQQNGSFDSTHNGSRSNNMMAFMQSVTGRFPYRAPGTDINNQSQDTHAAVGQQLTFTGTPSDSQQELLATLQRLADSSEIGLIVKASVDSVIRGYAYMGNDLLQSDLDNINTTMTELLDVVRDDSLLATFTAVPAGSEIRLGVDADTDGSFDRDEVLAGTDPLDPESFIEPDCAVTQPVARLAGTRQSTGHFGDQFPSQLAVDGDPSTFTHTDASDSNPTLTLDLNSDYTLNEIELINRLDSCCLGRLRDITIEAYDRTGQMVFTSEVLNPGNAMGNPASISLPLNGSVRARKLLIKRDASASGGADSGVLSLGDVNVSACTSYADPTTEPPVLPPVTDNLLSNPSFESGTTDWLSCSSEQFTSTTDSSSGNLALAVQNSACAYQEFPVTPGTDYSLQCSASRGTYASITLTINTADYVQLAQEVKSVSTTNYSTHGSTISAPTGAAIGVVTLYGEGSATKIDDCIVTEVAPGTPPVTPPVTGPTNILANGGFESDLDSWFSCGPENGVTVSTSASVGVQAVQVSSGGCLYQEFPILETEGLSLQCQAKRNGNLYSSVQLSSANGIYQQLQVASTAIDSNDYEAVELAIPASPGATIGVVTLYSEDVADFDDCVVAKR